MEDDLDISWTDSELLDNRREPLDEIRVAFIYINGENAIEKVDCDTEPLDATHNISKERLLHLVQKKRHVNDKKYRLTDILLFEVPVEYDDLSCFIKDGGGDGDYLKSIPVFHEVKVEPALLIFHDITFLYVFFAESAKPLKSIMKNDDNRSTKKVRMNVADEYLNHKKKSLRKFIKNGKRTRKHLSVSALAPVESDTL